MPGVGRASVASEHRTVSRVMAIIELVVASEPNGVRLGDLAAPIEAAKSSVHVLARGLVAIGYLREQDGRYFTGPAVFSLLGSGHPSLLTAYHHALEELAGKWQETAFIATLVGDSMVYIDIVESPRPIRAAPALHTRVPLWPRSSGKCLLAFMEPRRQEAYLRRTFKDAVDRDRVERELRRIREASVAVNLGETDPDLYGIASPIVSAAGGPVTMAIALAGPASRMDPHVDEMLDSVRDAAAALARSSGASSAWGLGPSSR